MKSAILVGMSMGGYVSQAFADMYPDMVEGLVALDTSPFGLDYYSKLDIWFIKRISKMAGWLPDVLLRKSLALSISKTAYSYEKMLEMLKPLTKEQIIALMEIGYGAFIAENRDVDFSFPIIILLGANDRTGKTRAYCRSWAAKTGYPLRIIKNAAHFSNGDNAEQVNAEIKAFILSHP